MVKVSGELKLKWSVMITVMIFVVGAIVTAYLNPYALVLYCSAYLFNILYEYLKGVPMIGNLWFGMMIAMSPLFGAQASTDMDLKQLLMTRELMLMALFVMFSASTMCYFTYFKDPGDKKKHLERDFEAAGVFNCALIALFNPLLGIILTIMVIIPTKFLFWWMYRKREY